MELQDTFSEAELQFIKDSGVIFEEVTVNGLDVCVDEDLVTDYIMLAGYSTSDAYAAAEAVAKFDTEYSL